MGKKIKIIPGLKYGKLTIIHETKPLSNNKTRVTCGCDCGNLHDVDLSLLRAGKLKSCGCIHAKRLQNQDGPKNPAWKGGRRIESSGYVEIYLPQHPFSRQTGYIKEHRLVMEVRLKRYLVKGENVHHINGNKEDNRDENLELWNTSQPAGQRIEDKLKWAKEIIKLYEE